MKFTPIVSQGESCLKRGVTWGVFDGVHRGHVLLIQKLQEECFKRNYLPTVLVVHPNPKQCLGDPYLPCLTPFLIRIKLLLGLHLKEIWMLEFSEDMRRSTPEEFLAFLEKQFDLGLILAGYDLKFGYKQSGAFSHIQKFFKNKGVWVGQEKALFEPALNGSIGSQKIRQLIQEGDLKKAQLCLGYPFFFWAGLALCKEGMLFLKLSENQSIPPLGGYVILFLGEKAIQSERVILAYEKESVVLKGEFQNFFFEKEVWCFFYERLEETGLSCEVPQEFFQLVKEQRKLFIGSLS